MTLREALVTAVQDLDTLKAPYAVIGGLAVSARIEPRMTRDVDLAVAVANDEAAEAVIYDLTHLGYTIVGVLEQSAAGRLSTIRLRPRGLVDSGILLDLLFASSGIEHEVAAAAERLQILKGVVAPVATVGHLIALKLLSQGAHRPQDAVDLLHLAQVAGSSDWAEAGSAVALISERGFARGRNLVEAMAALRNPTGA